MAKFDDVLRGFKGSRQYTETAIKTLKDVSFVRSGITTDVIDEALLHGFTGQVKEVEKLLKKIKELNIEEKKREEIINIIAIRAERLKEYTRKQRIEVETMEGTFKSITRFAKQHNIELKKTTTEIKKQNVLYEEMGRILEDILKQNQEIYKTSHQMQLEGNLTWGEFTKAYDKAYESARRMNIEAGKSVHNAREIVATHNQLLLDGWRGLDVNTVSTLSTQVMLFQKTLGDFPKELGVAFQQSYRVLGEANNQFVTELGNRLNAFQDTFGTSLGMFTNLITTMMNSNSLISKENMQSQIRANESLIKASALMGQVGILATNFVTDLALTSQYGTMEQMAGIYQGGALLRGFSTADFQAQMMGQDYYGATKNLISSIYNTLSGIEDHYLRAEYMQQIGGAFGINQQDLLAIMRSGGDISEIEEKITETLNNQGNSMQEELRGLRVDLKDRLENFFNNSVISQSLGKLMNEFGLYGITPDLKRIQALIIANMSKDSMGGKLLGGIFKGGSGAGRGTGVGATQGTALLGPDIGGKGISAGGALMALGGTYMGVTSNINTYNQVTQAKKDEDTSGMHLGNILASTAGGAMAGGAIGGPVGALVGGAIGLGAGVIMGSIAEHERDKKITEQLDEQARRERRARQEQVVKTGDHAMDKLIEVVQGFRGDVTGNMEESLKFQVTSNMLNKARLD